jgi:hypothetical protein
VLIFNLYELGGNLVVEGIGSLNLPASSLYTSICTGVLALGNVLCTGLSSNVNTYGITGPITLGAGIVPTTVSSSSNSGIGLAYRIAVEYSELIPHAFQMLTLTAAPPSPV